MKITFFTTTTYSDIQETQSSCIKKYFPDSEHILIDGRTGWFMVWYEWLNIANNIDSDWFIHIDEDCFITSADEINNTINHMIENSYDIAGCPDGHHEYRSANHMALNSFFMIVNKKAVTTWVNRTHTPQFKKEWIEEYPFEKRNTSNFNYNMEFGSSGKNVGSIWIPNTEPYYDFFWVLKENNINFLYLEPTFHNDYQTTNLLKDSVWHMWHQRDRNSPSLVSILHKKPNKQRFDDMINQICKNIQKYE